MSFNSLRNIHFVILAAFLLSACSPTLHLLVRDGLVHDGTGAPAFRADIGIINDSIAFVGDTAGLCRPGSRVVLPPTPPPDINLEAWRTSTETILAWHPKTLFLTHFGPHGSPEGHFRELWNGLDDWSRRVQASLGRDGSDEERAAAFANEIADELTRRTSRAEADAYARAGRFDYSWSGLARYWRKKQELSA